MLTDWIEIKEWRKAKRAELVACRAALSRETRRHWDERITTLLFKGFHVASSMVVGFCWPYKGEFDSRFVIRRWRDEGAVAALPEVVSRGQPLQFRKWWPGAPMIPGVYEIPVPSGTDIVVPDIAIVPMNGFDERGYRLGYGGGFFDRTLAAYDRRMLAIGVGYELSRLPTLYPQPHDVPMDFVVTEAGVHVSEHGKLVRLDLAQSRKHAALILQQRGLPRSGPLPAMAGFHSPPCYAGEFSGYWGEELAPAKKSD